MIEIAGIAHRSGGRVGDRLAPSPDLAHGHSQFDRLIFHIRPCYSSGCLPEFNFEELNAVFHLT